MLPAAERGRRRRSALRLTYDRMDYRKTPLSATALYASICAQTQRLSCAHLILHPSHISEQHALAVSEYPFVLSFATALRIMMKYAPHDDIHIRISEEGEQLELTISVTPETPNALQTAFRAAEEALSDLSEPSHFLSKLCEEAGTLTYVLSAPYYDMDAFELYANDELLATVAKRAFTAAWNAII